MANNGLNRAAQRIQRELQEIRNEEFLKSGISAEPMEDSLMKLKCKILGPPGTPYEGGIYTLQIEVPDDYPFKPVKVRFLTKIWHPNICSVSGEICLNILETDWVVCLSLRTVLISLQALLSAAEPYMSLDFVAGKQYRENQELFKLTAKHWSQVYAGAPRSNSEFERSLMDGRVDEGKLPGSNSEFERSLMGGRVDKERVPGSNSEFERSLMDREVDEDSAPVVSSSSF